MYWKQAVVWLLLFVLCIIEIVIRRRTSQEVTPCQPEANRQTSPIDIIIIAGTALVLGIIRFYWAQHRGQMNVDESAFAGLSEFLKSTGSSIFSFPWILRFPILAYLPGDLATHQSWANGFASLSSGLAAFIMGALVLRILRSKPAAVWTVIAYSVGILPFEGLSANKEPFANLFIAAYLYSRLSGAVFSKNFPLRQITRGFLLGAAFVFKDQTAPMVLLEPIFEYWEVRSKSTEKPFREFLSSQLYAAAGFLVLPICILMGFYFNGHLEAYLGMFTTWLKTGGQGVEGAIFSKLSIQKQPFWIAVFNGFYPLLINPFTFLGLSVVIQILCSGKRLSEYKLLRNGLALAALVSIASTCIGQRWFLHYFMLVMPALAPLTAIRISSFLQEMRTPKLRWSVLLLWILAVYNVSILVKNPYILRLSIEGFDMPSDYKSRMNDVADLVRKYTKPEDPIQVWGWQPQIYFAAQRRPASRFMDNSTGSIDDLIPDFERFGHPGAIVMIGYNHIGVPPGMETYFMLSRHPKILTWLNKHDYKPVPTPHGYSILLPPERR